MSAELSASLAAGYERLSVALLLAVLGAALGSLVGRRGAIAAGLALPLAALIPLPSISLSGFVLAFTGALSAASLVLLGALGVSALSETARRERISRRMSALAAPVAVIGIALYAPVLGLGPYDPYRLGFSGLALPAVLFMLLAYAWFRRARLVAVWLAVAAFIALAGIHPSRNLWDALIDPIAVAIALVVALTGLVSRRRRPRSASPLALMPGEPSHS